MNQTMSISRAFCDNHAPSIHHGHSIHHGRSIHRAHKTNHARLVVCLLLLLATGGTLPLAWATQADDGQKDGLAAADSAQNEAKAAVRALPSPPNRAKPSRAVINKLISRYAERYGLEHDLVHAVVRAESGYNAHAVSSAGAVGLMQIMPATGADYGVGSVDALFDAPTNIRVGTRHLQRLIGRYGIGKAIMAYNAGEGVLERHNGFVTYPETQRYTHRVLSRYLQKKGVGPYSSQARQITGISLTPAMASAGGSRGSGQRRVRRGDLSTLSLRVRPSLSNRALDPSAHSVGPESKPMFVLDPAAVRK